MAARTGTDLRVWVNGEFDQTTDALYSIDNPAGSTWDHTFGRIGTTWYAFSAPWISSNQTIAMYTSADLNGPWSKTTILDPGGSYWDYWPHLFVDGLNGYLFYTNEDGGFGRISVYNLP